MALPTEQEAKLEIAGLRERIARAETKLEDMQKVWGVKAARKRAALRADIEHWQKLIRMVQRYLRGESV